MSSEGKYMYAALGVSTKWILLDAFELLFAGAKCFDINSKIYCV